QWGNILVPLAAALVVATILLALFSVHWRVALFILILRPLLALLSIATIVMTILVGHSGAEAVWKDKYASAKVPLALSLDEFTAEEVSQHNTATDCWTIVDGFVYDVTTFTRRHPGGAEKIEEMCGVNATEDYLDEHDGQREPKEWLETLKIGRLK
ncbi:MAG: cytochrome b5 domain-containing protein, partial [Actinomycetota bacterium]